MKKKKSIRDFLIQYFKKHPNEDMQHGPVVDWVEDKYKRLYKRKPRDTWRSIRGLHERGLLIKVRKGVYRYDPKAVKKRKLEDFTPDQKAAIMKRDAFRCVICGRGEKEGVELHIDHIRPRYLGGVADIENGQTLCAQHNFIKKHLKQTETGKKMFIRLYKLAKKEKNKGLLRFCTDILQTYEDYDINGHIIWER